MKAYIGHTPYCMSTAIYEKYANYGDVLTLLECHYRTIDRCDEECNFELMSIEPCWAYISRDKRTIIIKKAMADRDGCAAH